MVELCVQIFIQSENYLIKLKSTFIHGLTVPIAYIKDIMKSFGSYNTICKP